MCYRLLRVQGGSPVDLPPSLPQKSPAEYGSRSQKVTIFAVFFPYFKRNFEAYFAENGKLFFRRFEAELDGLQHRHGLAALLCSELFSGDTIF